MPSPEDCFEETCTKCSKKIWCGCCGDAPGEPDSTIDYCLCNSIPCDSFEFCGNAAAYLNTQCDDCLKRDWEMEG